MKFRKVLLVCSKNLSKQDLQATAKLCDSLTSKFKSQIFQHGLDDQKFFEDSFSIWNQSGDDKPDLVISLGGDGTFLRALSYFQSSKTPPIMGFMPESSHIGFYCPFKLNKYTEAVDLLQSKMLNISQLKRLKVQLFEHPDEDPKQTSYALNEIFIDRHSHPTPINMSILVESKNGEKTELSSFTGDGVIICTAMGSTAYNLSSGGPLVDPVLGDRAMVLTLLAPFSLSFRPIVFDGLDRTIILKPGPKFRNSAHISTDGCSMAGMTNPKSYVKISLTDERSVSSIQKPRSMDDKWPSKLVSMFSWAAPVSRNHEHL